MAPQGIHISLVGAIPKTHKPGKYQLIMDLSSIIGEKSYPRHQRSLPDGIYSPSGSVTDSCAMKSLLTECYHFGLCSAPKLFSAVADALQ